MNKNTIVKYFVIGVIVVLYILTSLISTLHVIDFFELSNPTWLAVTLAISFEIGAAASLAALLILDKVNKTLTWSLFILLTAIQINGNLYYAYVHLANFESWSELFGLSAESLIVQKRILSIVSGAVLPIIALGFIKSLVDYLRPEKDANLLEPTSTQIQENITEPIEPDPIFNTKISSELGKKIESNDLRNDKPKINPNIIFEESINNKGVNRPIAKEDDDDINKLIEETIKANESILSTDTKVSRGLAD